MNEFYVYEWFIVDTLKVFYVGKGKGRRRFVKSRNQHFNNTIKKYDCAVRLVKSSLTEQEAFELEKEALVVVASTLFPHRDSQTLEKEKN